MLGKLPHAFHHQGYQRTIGTFTGFVVGADCHAKTQVTLYIDKPLDLSCESSMEVSITQRTVQVKGLPRNMRRMKSFCLPAIYWLNVNDRRVAHNSTSKVYVSNTWVSF